ncbi:hypothetical protein FB446DRAFT_794261 [Lentinula raphanica]|nr:hypothetical protein FB446DRAFT_794261 [Lentinula raphanica]
MPVSSFLAINVGIGFRYALNETQTTSTSIIYTASLRSLKQKPHLIYTPRLKNHKTFIPVVSIPILFLIAILLDPSLEACSIRACAEGEGEHADHSLRRWDLDWAWVQVDLFYSIQSNPGRISPRLRLDEDRIGIDFSPSPRNPYSHMLIRLRRLQHSIDFFANALPSPGFSFFVVNHSVCPSPLTRRTLCPPFPLPNLNSTSSTTVFEMILDRSLTPPHSLQSSSPSPRSTTVTRLVIFLDVREHRSRNHAYEVDPPWSLDVDSKTP